MESNEAHRPRKGSANIRSFFQRKKDSTTEGDAVQAFMFSFRKRLSSFGPNFASFMYPFSTSDDKAEHGLSDQERNENGLSNNMSALFVISAITGSAILSLPLALKDSGWLGAFMIIICGINSLYSGMILGWCWNIMQESWPEYKKISEVPYPEMGRRAVGNWMKYTIMVFLVISQVGSCIVYMVLIAKHLEGASSGKPKFCYMMILALFLIAPLTWFRAPRDFWFMAIIDVFCSTFFIFLLLIAFFIDKDRIGLVNYPHPTFSSFSVSFGSLMFSYAGGGVYPTIQNDMKNRKLFPQSVFTGFLLIFTLYIPFAIMGYAAYGHTLGNDITETIMKNQNLKGLAKFLQVLSLAQLTTTLVIYLNPTFQLLEYLLECPKSFGYKRCAIRSGVMFVIFIIAFGIPFLLKLAEVIAAVTIGCLTSIFPTIFYIRLVHKGIKKGKERKITFKNGTLLAGITSLGVLGTIAALFMAQNQLSFKTNVKNCYADAPTIKAANETFNFENKSQSLMYVNQEFDHTTDSQFLKYMNDTFDFENDSAFIMHV